MPCLCRILQCLSFKYRTSRGLIWSTARCFYQNRTINFPEAMSLSKQSQFDIRTSLAIWKRKRNSIHFQNYLKTCFSRHDNISSYFVMLINQACLVGSSCSQDHVLSLLLNFKKYIDDNKTELVLTTEQKNVLLNSITRFKNMKMIQVACLMFKNNDCHDEFMKAYIENLLKERKYIEAAYFISVLNFHHNYSMEEILLPLLLEGKVHTVMTCISNEPHLQINLAKKLDSMLEVIKRENSKDADFDETKKIFKTLSTFIMAFNIPPEQCKNLHHIRSRGALGILVRKKEQLSIAESTWLEMVMSIINENNDLKEHLIYKLVLRKNYETARKMAIKLNMDSNYVEKLIAEQDAKINTLHVEDTDLELEEDIIEKEENEDSLNCLDFSLPLSSIKYVSMEEDFFNAMADITENYKMVGIDTEWKPRFGLSQDRLSLVQIAVYDKVYIIDVLALAEILGSLLWDKLIENIFGNPKIIKLGCGIVSDIQMIVDSHNTMGYTIRFSNTLDMAVFYQKLQDVYPEELGDKESSKKGRKGLSTLCEIILGHPLNKEERLCDWEKRPLKPSQLEYAALDAHCLLLIFEKLKQDALAKDMNFSHLAKVAAVMTASQWKPKRRAKGNITEETLQVQKPVEINNFKVAVDAKLEAQGRELRLLGANVIILNATDTPEVAEEISRREGRLILCSDDFWKQVNKSSPMQNFMRLSCENHEHSVSHILQKFNVQVKAKNILSRCTFCNSEDRLKLSSSGIEFLEEERNHEELSGTIDCDLNDLKQALDNLKEREIIIKFCASMTKKMEGHGFLCRNCGYVCR